MLGKIVSRIVNRLLDFTDIKVDLNRLKKAKVDESLQTLYYFLNEFVDITKLPPTRNSDLRVMQECDALLLALFDKVCKKHNLVYWLSYGTLLGAVRHKGFIPWDDDMDVAMLRSDFNKLQKILEEELVPLGFTVSDFNAPSKMIGLGYMHSQTGTWVDIFPVDTYKSSQSLESGYNDLVEKANIYKQYYENNKSNADSATIDAFRDKMLTQSGSYSILFHGLEYDAPISELLLFDKEDVFPLSTLSFEGVEVPVPCCYDKYLTAIFGNYMSFPKTGILLHDEGRGPLHTWAKKNGIIMDEIKDTLAQIVNSYY